MADIQYFEGASVKRFVPYDSESKLSYWQKHERAQKLRGYVEGEIPVIYRRPAKREPWYAVGWQCLTDIFFCVLGGLLYGLEFAGVMLLAALGVALFCAVIVLLWAVVS